MLLVPFAFPLLCTAQVHPSPPLEIHNGKLASVAGTGLVLQSGKKELKLSARTTYLLHTLQDKRLDNKEVRLEGLTKPDGTLEVDHFFTVHDGKLFRVRYYCEVCNIEALEPGRCVCCQQPTELQEIPVSETK
ncbi:MAG TPA: hypothetical protein VKV95_23635 [Terriglobia bacterium]|nr:hypothetical protein [Terriglobia bacterium]